MNFELLNEERSGDSRIISVKIKIYNNILQFTNVYAPSGSSLTEKDDFFQKDLLYYLRGDIGNIILGGDYNCVIAKRDSSSKNVHISKGLSNIIKSLALKDAWFTKNQYPHYTFVRQNYGARLDRIYVKNLYNNVTNIKLIHLHNSDHSGVHMELELPKVPKVGKYYWKLNNLLLDSDKIKYRFKGEWDKIKTKIGFYESINTWWEMFAKHEIRNFFKKVGKEEKLKKYGLLQFLEHQLNRT